jgi:endogenous inhibitor of DNA gyrase (YacG/DUF329 family)
VRAVRCPICQSEVSWEDNPHRPFCSERCRLIDLGGWSEGRYRIPGEKVGDKADKSEEADKKQK